MDKTSKSKAIEGGSSEEEEEAFESADEGEEDTKSEKPSSATSADIGSVNSTLKELVGKSDVYTSCQVTSGEEIKSSPAEEGKQITKMDEEERKLETPARDDPDMVRDEPSPSSKESVVHGSEASETENVEEGTDKINDNTPEISEDKAIKAAKTERDYDVEKVDTEAGKHEVNEDQCPENEHELLAKENIIEGEDDGQKEASENFDKDPQQSSTEPTCDHKVEGTRDR